MKKIFLILIGIIWCNILSAQHLINNVNYRQKVHKQFIKREVEMSARGKILFDVFKKPLSVEQREALEFLYAYMPLSDLADYSGNFFLSQVDVALATKTTFKWGKQIPEDIFRHFVLPYRINNENLDSSRMVFYKELKSRIMNMSMKDAVLEVNHWCHEKVTYRGTDIRTSAPLSTVKNSFGRCGEESTFTTTALRSVGIPARQCYTPRWAHSDDNHAWVEVWIDGKWYFMGACEPESDLNMGWFDGPAKRAMMVHTNVFGNYEGIEEVNQKETWYTKINILPNYAPVKKLIVKVVDEIGKPAIKAKVNFGLYNYAEFYTIAFKNTDLKGFTSLVTGYGDLLVWATNGKNYGYQKVSVDKKDTVVIKMNRLGDKPYQEDFDLVVPIVRPVSNGDEKGKELNAQRLLNEDAIRTAYMSTFMKPDQAIELAKEVGLSIDSIKQLIGNRYGNYQEIATFIRQGAQTKNKNLVIPLLYSVSEKDLRDASNITLFDHLSNALNLRPVESITGKLFTECILNPRISNEILSPWRSLLFNKLKTEFSPLSIETPLKIKAWIIKNITIKENENYYNVPITPIGVYNLKQADKQSRNIFFVAVCRSLGFPARIETATGIAQYLQTGQWIDVNFEPSVKAVESRGTLEIVSAPSNTIKPEYYTHFTIGRLENGEFVSLDFEYSDDMKSLPTKINLIPGRYRMVTGNRMNNGNVLARTTYFDIEAGKTVKQVVELRPLIMKPDVIGTIDLNKSFTTFDGKVISLKDLAKENGVILSFLDPSREPTRHVMVDIPLLRESFEKWNGGMVFLLPTDKITPAFNSASYANMPKQSIFGKDENRTLLNYILKATKTNFENNFPLITLITPSGEIIFLSEGYRIGIGENLIKTIQLMGK
ncbi:MAG: transglutaminase domain-containing protein [Bacteroidetes bacterium]|nr:transglutaminase domain-containing protein [Bacteroidota bacterium]